jgi:hypothetical protein
MIRKVLSAVRETLNDPFHLAALSLVLLSTSLQGISDRILEVRGELAQLPTPPAAADVDQVADVDEPAGAPA